METGAGRRYRPFLDLLLAHLPDEGVVVIMEQREGGDEGVAEEIEVGVESDGAEAEIPRVALHEGVVHEGVGGAEQEERLDVSRPAEIAEEGGLPAHAVVLVPQVEVDHHDVLHAVHDAVGDGEDEQEGRVEARVVPQEVAGEQKQVLERVQGVAAADAPDRVPGVDGEVGERDRPGDQVDQAHSFRIHGYAPLVEHAHPDDRPQRGDHQHVDEEDPVEGEIEPAGDRRSGLRLEVVDAGEPVLLHEAVLVVPQGDDEDEAQGGVAHGEIGEQHQHHRTDDEAVAPAAELRGGAVHAQPGGEVVGHGHPQDDGRESRPGEVLVRQQPRRRRRETGASETR